MNCELARKFILLDLSEGARVEGIAKQFTNIAGAQSANISYVDNVCILCYTLIKYRTALKAIIWIFQ